MATTELKSTAEILNAAEKINHKIHATIYYSTDAKINKRARVSGTPFEDVFGISNTSVKKYEIMEVFIGFDYESELKSRGIESIDDGIGQDTIPKNKWYTNHTDNGVIKKHDLTNELYIWVMMDDKPILKKYFDTTTNKELDRIKLADFLPKEQVPKKLDIRTIKLSNIRKIIL
jgi:hypothetical protein